MNPSFSLPPDQTPLLVSLTFDDNGYSGLPASGHDGGMGWFLDLFRSRRNPDGSPVHASFYLKTVFTDGDGPEAGETVRQIQARAAAEGHELGSHTRNHPHGVDIDWTTLQRTKRLDMAAWLAEIDASLTALAGLGVPSPQGFRTPYLEYNDDTFRAVAARGFRYDTSIEAGWRPGFDGRTGIWPHTLETGSPDEAWMSRTVFGSEPVVGSFPGLWEVPVSVLSVPDDEACQGYGIAPGLRSRIHSLESYSQPGRVLGFDWNLWFEYGLTTEEVAAVFCHSLDLRLEGNRAPLIYGGHTDIYSPLYEIHDLGAPERDRCRASVAQRREAWRIFLDYALTKPEVRLCSVSEILDWMADPQPLSRP